jgi:hypothetical protein
MPVYRLYFIGDDDHVKGAPKIIDVGNDEQAIQEAERWVDGHDVEVWDQARKVARLSK